MVKVTPELPTKAALLNKVHSPPTPLNVSVVGEKILTPFVFIVFPVLVALKTMVPVVEIVMPARSVIEPEIVIVEFPAQVIVPPSPFPGFAEKLRSLQTAVALTVTVYAAFEPLELALKMALSAAVGKFPAPGAPPETVAQ